MRLWSTANKHNVKPFLVHHMCSLKLSSELGNARMNVGHYTCPSFVCASMVDPSEVMHVRQVTKYYELFRLKLHN